MSEEIKKTEQTELSEQELDKVAGGGANGKKGYGVGQGGDAVSSVPKLPVKPAPAAKAG